ncbi:type 1 glutamine amidotransferase [Acidithiobacillus sp. IBUN Pt1247-S3]|uniref:type 1 glutamine amidotransferase n=1 Tax=Acidithiobacillus sp. IBUN Pt1247-S3 TaxID=3166642 RepID=UPI0034E544C7
MATILVLQHHPDEGLGSLAPLLTGHGYNFDLRELDRGDPVPTSLARYAALILMGGPMSVQDEAEYPYLHAEKSLIRMAADDSCPILGHCLGAQLINVALGGTVARNPSGQELGWWPVALTTEGATYWPAVNSELLLFHWHGEHCATLPQDARVLAYNAATPVQGFALGDKILALQAHPEVTAAQIQRWIDGNAADLAQGGEYIQPVAKMLGDLDDNCVGLAAAAALYRPWLEQVERRR